MWWTKALSWGAGHWLPLSGLALLLAAFGTGYGLSYKRTTAAWEARWAAAEAKAVADAREQEGRWNGRIEALERERDELRQAVEIRSDLIDRINGSVRQLAARPRNLPPPASYTTCLDDLARERQWTAEGRSLLAEGAGLSATLGRERDLAVIDLWAAAEAWPR